MTCHNEGLVSVIVPAWNAERYISRTLRSIMAQTHRQLEVLVVDDGSTDGTYEIAQAFARQDSRFQVLRQANRGAAAARNRGAAIARGGLLAPCDSDDLWHPEKISRQLATMRAASAKIGFVYCHSVGINEEDMIIFPNWACSTVAGDVFHRMVEDNLPGSGSGVLIRREVFEAAGGYPEDLRYGDEWQLHIAIAAASKCAVVPTCLVAYRLRQDSLTSNIPGVADDLARTTRWIEKTWPTIPEEVLRRRAYIINRYLAFLFARHRLFGAALRCQLKAWHHDPQRAFGREPLEFLLLMLGEGLGLKRYYYRFWRKPQPWMEIAQRPIKSLCG
jgi:glycosyltransferase involved in cell wall biosynthesis